MSRKKNLIIFTDLDGTLLDAETYSYQAARPALQQLRKQNIPLIICTSKTRAEIVPYRRKIRINAPFISENGGAIFIPQGYFSTDFRYHKVEHGYQVIELGAPYHQLRECLREIRERFNCPVVGFGDMTAQEVASDCGLSLSEAKRARMREYDEPFRFSIKVDEELIYAIQKAIENQGFHVTWGGRYGHLLGDSNKGKAVEILSQLYRDDWKSEVVTVALGDSPNDLPMLQVVTIPIVVKKPDGTYDRQILQQLNPRRADGIGPEGWNKAVLAILKDSV